MPLALLGLRDTDDALVADTLRALADCVEILGANKVVGAKGRTRLFADGAPGGVRKRA